MQNQSQHQGALAAVKLSPQGEAAAAEIAERHGVSTGAVTELLSAIERGHGRQAQFSHPDLGGMGQWSRGGMLMIGDMFNNSLKAKVAALCEDVASLLDKESNRQPDGASEGSSMFAAPQSAYSGGYAWPKELGQASSTGSQNDMRYAVFPGTHRLAIARGDKVTVYDTGDHEISGFGQQQGSTGSLTLTSQHGDVRLDDLRVVDGRPAAATSTDAPSDEQKSAAPSGDKPAADETAIFAKIEGLAGLHAKGLLSDEEFGGKKKELLSRL